MVRCETGRFARTSGPLTERGLKYTIDCIQAMKDALGRRGRSGFGLWTRIDSSRRDKAWEGCGTAKRDVA